jgi:hypothetical protein
MDNDLVLNNRNIELEVFGWDVDEEIAVEITSVDGSEGIYLPKHKVVELVNFLTEQLNRLEE